MDNFFRVPTAIYRALKYPQNWIYVEICSRVNYGDPHAQLGIVCGHGQCAVTRTFLAYKYCRSKHKQPHTCNACKELISYHLKKMIDVIRLETVGSGRARLYRITLMQHVYPGKKSGNVSDNVPNNSVPTKPVERQRDKRVQDEEFLPMNLPKGLIPVLDYKVLDYQTYPPYLDITCEVLGRMGKQAIRSDDMKKAYGLVKAWVNEFKLDNDQLLTITTQAINEQPIKSSVTGWMETVLHLRIEDEVSHKMSQEKNAVLSKRMHEASAQKQEEARHLPYEDPHQLDKAQVESNKEGLAAVIQALRDSEGVDDADKD